jgi:hypothetical protein
MRCGTAGAGHAIQAERARRINLSNLRVLEFLRNKREMPVAHGFSRCSCLLSVWGISIAVMGMGGELWPRKKYRMEEREEKRRG